MEKQLPRKLAVILHADVVGSTALVQQNEAITHERIHGVFERFSETIRAYGGISHEIRGDALVAEFERTSDAVAAALAFQALNDEFNSTLSDNIQPNLRIGISLGEVIIADGTITGAGVVLAQRLEQLANSGGVVVQGSVSETVPTRMPFKFENLGEQNLKGFAQPVRVYVATLEPGEKIPAPEENITSQTINRASNATVPASVLSDLFSGRAAVAVLPFRCLSCEEDDVFFADGITEDVVNGLAAWRWFPVIGRYTTDHYRDAPGAMDIISNETGARYVIDGSVRRSGSRLRVTAELCDAASGQQLWSQHFEGNRDDVFEIQDKISDDIARLVEPEISRAESVRLYRQKPSELSVWEMLHKARVTKFQSGHAFGTKEDNVAAMAIFREIAARDPNSSDAISGIATCHWHDAINSWSGDPVKSGESAMRRAKEAVDLDSTNYRAMATTSIIQVFGQHDIPGGEVTARKSLDMNPSDIVSRHYLVCSLEFGGKFDEAVEQCKYMMALDPHAPALSVLYGDLSTCLLLSGNAVEAVEYSRKSMEADPGYSRGRQRFIAALVAAGEMTEAKQEFSKLQKAMPAFNLDYVKRTYPFVNEQHLDAYSRYFAEVGVK